MHVNCKRSCNNCADPCERRNDSLAVGDINVMFRRAAAMAEYAPRVLSEEPWVVVLDSFLSNEEAAEVVRVGGHKVCRVRACVVSCARSSLDDFCLPTLCRSSVASGHGSWLLGDLCSLQLP